MRIIAADMSIAVPTDAPLLSEYDSLKIPAKALLIINISQKRLSGLLLSPFLYRNAA